MKFYPIVDRLRAADYKALGVGAQELQHLTPTRHGMVVPGDTGPTTLARDGRRLNVRAVQDGDARSLEAGDWFVPVGLCEAHRALKAACGHYCIVRLVLTEEVLVEALVTE